MAPKPVPGSTSQKSVGSDRYNSISAFTRRVLIVIGLISAAIVVWRVREAFLLLFGGVVLAVILNGLTEIVCKWTRMPRKWSLWVVTLLLLAGLAAGLWILYPKASAEVARYSERLPEIRESLEQYGWGRVLLDLIASQENVPGWESVAERITGFAMGLFHAVIGFLLILFIGIFLSVNPSWYIKGIADSFPKAQRKRMGQVLDASGEALWRWLIAQSIAMLLVGSLSTVGLLLVGAPSPVTLGVLAGLFQFVPFVGPIMWALPALLLGFSASPEMALKVLIVYTVVQTVETNLITPIVQNKTAHVPPVIILVSTVAMGLLLGPLGLILATPLTVVGMVFYQMLYRNDTLGDHVDPLAEDT